MKINKLTNNGIDGLLNVSKNTVKQVIKNTKKNNSLERAPITDEFTALVANDSGLLNIIQKTLRKKQ